MTPKCPDCKRYQDDCICASPASAPDGSFKSWWNSDSVSTDNPYSEESPIYWAWEGWRAALAASPTPPVSEDRKDAERFREGWTHACNALCMEIALWIERCPHCGMPAPKAPAMQEDKP